MTNFVENLAQEYCTALTALHTFTHCDSISAFKGIGKVKPIKVMQKNPRFQGVLAKLGEQWYVSEEVISGLEAFTCAIYGRSRVTSVDELRCILIREKCESKYVKQNKLPMLISALFFHAGGPSNNTSAEQIIKWQYGDVQMNLSLKCPMLQMVLVGHI